MKVLSERTMDIEMFSIIDYLEDRGIDYSTAGTKNVSAGWIGISCPFCGDHSNHLGIRLDTNLYSCFKCGAKGGPTKLIRELDNCSFQSACNTMFKFVATDFSHLVKKERPHAEKTMLPSGTSSNFLPIHDKFLAARRYDRTFLERRYDIMAVGPTCDDWRFRIVIPVYLNQNMVTYVARDCSGKAEIKYKNAPVEKSVLQAKHVLYGLDNVKDTVILVEGIFDAWRIGTHAVCTFGTMMTTEQMLLLKQKGIKRLIMLFDSDAIKKAEQLVYTLSSIVKQVELVELFEGDPDDMDENSVWELKRTLGMK